MATIETEQWVLMVILMFNSLLNIAYLLPISFHAFFPNISANKSISSASREQETQIKEAPLLSLIAIIITTLACLTLFIPNLYLTWRRPF